ncbi:MAG: long-chain acyl-CoA synthetase [Gammaproteobacteria bacterium]|nr:long-chain acyl-CoA synthetase [Gammaproteobacteria bacterium]
MAIFPATGVEQNKPACIDADSCQILSFRTLDERANQGARLLRRLELEPSDVLAVLLPNCFEVFAIAWAAQRTGLYLTTISPKLSAADIRYILQDSGAKVLITSLLYAELAAAAIEGLSVEAFLSDGENQSFADWAKARDQFSAQPISDAIAGADMLYSSGTTGRPKGVKPALPTGAVDAPTPLMRMGQTLYGMDEHSIYLNTSPLYHAAPLRWAMTIHRLGGTVVFNEKFDAAQTLSLIDTYKITHATFVPTHFIRMLKLPEAIRGASNHSTLKAIVHAAAPCPVPIKRAMIDWWGPIIHEYYSGTEMCGITALSAGEWLEKPGSVGRAVLGQLRIVDDEGRLLPPDAVGNVYFADGPAFEYHHDPDKTRAAHEAHGWATMGDIGHVDADGYLFLTDRKHFMIISGGVNIYPQEVENLLVTHPQVADVAVFGVPDEEMGESVLAVIQPASWKDAGEGFAEELRKFVRDALGSVKCPRQFDFREVLPREPTGKLMKRLLQEEYRKQPPHT